jgi:uroporphyrinogen decarboxylase
MTGRERVQRTLAFNHPDKIPVLSWALPEVFIKYGQKLRDEVEKYNTDFHRPDHKDAEYPFDRYAVGAGRDAWGCVWRNQQPGIIGEVKEPPLATWDGLKKFKAPYHIIEEGRENLAEDIRRHRDKFIFPRSNMNLFERMQHIRGTENLLMDIAEESDEFYTLLDIVYDYYDKWVDKWLQYDIDNLLIADDWGSQGSLLISPLTWRRIYKPRYKAIIDKIRKAGRHVFFHSDGCIESIFCDLVELEVSAINSQLWIMDKERLSHDFRGKVTFWGELDRQGVLARGDAAEILHDIKIMKSLFMHNGGGLIGTAAPCSRCSYDGIVETVAGWNRD